jgi:hypothetical protein
MKSKLFSAFFMASALIASHVQAQDYDQADKWKGCYKGVRTPAAVVNHDNVSITTNKALKVEQVKRAIQQAAGEKGWTVSEQVDGKLAATYSKGKNGRHSISVEIAYSADKYSIRYKNSSNMNYVVCDGQGVIHPYYNNWVMELKTSIQNTLQSL